jgi:ATP-binding cassette, subfamily C (CFTR/MRP), member 1
MTDKSPSAYSFIIASFFCFRWQVLRTMPARLAITGFTYSQTFLINAAISYLETPAPLRNINHAYGLIAATGLIYFGIAVSFAVVTCRTELTRLSDSYGCV